MGSNTNGIGYLSKELLEGFDIKQKKDLRKMSENELVTADSNSQDEQFGLASCKEAEDCKDNLGQRSSEVSSSPRGG